MIGKEGKGEMGKKLPIVLFIIIWSLCTEKVHGAFGGILKQAESKAECAQRHILLYFQPALIVCGDTFFGENNPHSKDDRIDSGTGIGYIMSEVNYIIDCCGIVNRWEAEFGSISGSRTVDLQVWRETSISDEYEMVGKNSFTVSSNGEQATSISQANRITVKSGDKFGWRTSGTDMITYKRGGGEEDNNWLLSIGSKSTGDTQDWSGKTNENDRSYAIRMDVLPNNTPSFSNLPTSKTILNNVGSGVSLYTVAVTDIDTYDISTLSVTMTANSQFSFDTATLILSTGTITTAGTVQLQFKVSDQCDNTATSTYTVTINNDPPVITSLPSSANLSEDTTAETLLHTIGVTDSVDTPTCSMASSVPASYPFLVKQVTSTTDNGIYSSLNPGLDHSVASSYTLTIDCTDGSTTVSSTFTVDIIPNSSPVIVNLQNATSIATSITVGATVFTVITTDAEGDTLSYSMTCSLTPCPFQIFASGVILVTQDLSGSSTVGYDLYITVSDARNSDGPETLTVTISDINDPVLISNLPLSSSLTIAENTALGTSVYTVSYTDLDTSQTITFTATSTPPQGGLYFNIDSSSGLISTSGSVLNYETFGATTCTISVTVSDPVTSDTQNLVIDITDVNESPAFNPTSYSLSANEPAAGALIGTPSFGITDPDTGDRIAYTMHCLTSNSYFLMNRRLGRVTLQSDYDLDTGSLSTTVTCTVTATDSGGLTSTATLIINIANINDNTPTFVPSVYTFYISYYATVGTTVGTVMASDGDTGVYGTLTFTLDQSSLGAAYFGIDNSGLIVLATAPVGSSALNYSGTATISAIATDSGGLTATAAVTIIVSDTTTTSTTTTTDSYMTFFDAPYNWAWFIPCMIIVIATFLITFWVAWTCRGEKGCGQFVKKLCQQKNILKLRRHSNPFRRRRGSVGNRRRSGDSDIKELEQTVSARNPPPPIEHQEWRRQDREVSTIMI